MSLESQLKRAKTDEERQQVLQRWQTRMEVQKKEKGMIYSSLGAPGPSSNPPEPSSPTAPARKVRFINRMEFHKVEENGDQVTWQLDARVPWGLVKKDIKGPAEITVEADPEMWAFYPDWSAGPVGRGPAPENLVKDLPVPEADYLSLVGKLDDGKGFMIGGYKVIQIPEGTHELRMMANLPLNGVSNAVGGHKCTIKVVQK